MSTVNRQRAPVLGYQPALDGLRAVAVVLVMLYHQRDDGMGGFGRGGFIGVDVFFVLSGFLITTLLLQERHSTGSVNFGRFWSRRLRRLVPAMLLMLVFVALLAQLVFSPQVRAVVHGDVPWVLGYVENWRLALNRGPIASPLSHTWSLGIEEQWYLLWPLALVLLVRVTRDRRTWLVVVVGACAVASMVWGGHLFQQSPPRAYFGTDVRAQELLVGAGLAFIGAIGWRTAVPRFARWFDVGAVVVFAGLLGVGMFVGDGSAWEPAGRLILALATAIVITSLVAPRSPLRSLLAIGPLVVIGGVSYGLYLFHFPIYVWLSPERVGVNGVPLMLIRFSVTAVIAAASFVLVERPIRAGRFPGHALVTAGAVVAAVVFVTTGIGAVVPLKPRSPLLAYAIEQAAASAPPGARRVLVVGGTRVSLLGQEAHGAHDVAGIHGLALGVFRCGLTGPGAKCRAIPDDLAALAQHYGAGAVVAVLDSPDVTAAASPTWRGDEIERSLERMQRAAGARPFGVIAPDCGLGVPVAARTRLLTVVATWAARHGVQVADGGPCPVTPKPFSAAQLWQSVARVSAPAGP